MARRFEEIDWAETAWGTISLRRRFDVLTRREVHEVKLDDDFLMSSQFTVTEQELAHLGLGAVAGDPLTVLVGGLGLGYTAVAALRDPRVRSLTVVEALAPVIDWHRRDLLPDTRGLAADPRVTVVEGDFFALVRDRGETEPVDVLLVDIDHAPDHLLREDHADLYTPLGMRGAADLVRRGGAFALWSDDPPDTDVVDLMLSAFSDAQASVVGFDNPLTDGVSTATIYLARGPKHR